MRQECPDYLSFFPQPFLEDLVKGRVLPFIGAGFSRNAIAPPGVTIPDFEQLTRALASQIPGYVYMNPIDATAAYEQAYGRAALIEALAQQLNREDFLPGPAHIAFAELPFDLVATTNFDFLLERAYERVGRPVYPVMYEDQLSVNPEVSPGSVELLKIHGDFNNPGRIIVTERDYDTFAARFPLYTIFLANLFITKTPLFIGYSINDYDLRFIYESVGSSLGPLMRLGYTLQVDANPDDIARFERRGVRVINLPSMGLAIGEVFACAFQQLREYWLSHLAAQAGADTEEIETAIKQWPSTSKRLCLCVVPKPMVSAYRRQVFPVIRQHGLIPITGDEIHAPASLRAAALMTAAREAGALVTDSGHPLFRTFVTRAQQIPVLFVAEKGSMPVPVAERVWVTTREFGRPAGPEVAEAVEKWLKNMAGCSTAPEDESDRTGC